MTTPRFVAGVLLASIVLMPCAAAAQVTWDWWPGPTPPEALEKLMPNAHQWPTEQQLKAVEELLPETPVVAPVRPRRVLVWGRLWTHGAHASTVLFQETMKALGRKTGAFEAVGSDDPLLLLPEKLKDFDAIFWNSLHDPAPFLPQNWQGLSEEKQAAATKLDAAIKESILRFVMEDGKGVGGIVGSIAAHQRNWPAYGEMMGAFYGGHYAAKMVIQAEDPDHPLVACLEGKPWEINTVNAYLPGAPYSRDNLRVLLSLDVARSEDPGEKSQWLREVLKRLDGDMPISWIRRHGKGRVFYVAIGYSRSDYQDPVFLRHLLAATQFLVGDLPADTTPSGPRKAVRTD